MEAFQVWLVLLGRWLSGPPSHFCRQIHLRPSPAAVVVFNLFKKKKKNCNNKGALAPAVQDGTFRKKGGKPTRKRGKPTMAEGGKPTILPFAFFTVVDSIFSLKEKNITSKKGGKPTTN